MTWINWVTWVYGASNNPLILLCNIAITILLVNALLEVIKFTAVIDHSSIFCIHMYMVYS